MKASFSFANRRALCARLFSFCGRVLSLLGRPLKRWKVVFSGLFLMGCLSCLLLYWADQRWPLPKPSGFSTVVLDSSGHPLRSFADPQGNWRYPVANSEVAPVYLDMLLAYEDRAFYWHPGINPWALMRAAGMNLLSGHIVSGGSTLTMQVARLMEPEVYSQGSRSWGLKFRQMARALQLEWHESKAQILNRYLNSAPFGGPLVGVEAAAYSYFGKSAAHLSDAEAALLVVLPQRPSGWRPDRYPERARLARDKVLERMVDQGHWSAQRVADAKLEQVAVLTPETPFIAPIFSRELHQRLPEAQRIQTLIDGGWQRRVEAEVARYRQGLAAEQSIAVVVMDNQSHGVKAYVGSADFFDEERQGQVDMGRAVRSPGSALKPFLYAMAMDQGLIHSQSLLMDIPRWRAAYRPRNFSGGFSGPVSVEEALQRSLNLPAVQVLDALGPGTFASRLQQGGLTLYGAGARNPNESLILGGIGVRLLDMVGLYSALANQGLAATARLTEADPQVSRYLVSPASAWVAWRMLARHPNPLLQSLIQRPWQMAWKTGTSYGFRDAWAIGVTQNLTIGVWVGRPDGSPSPGDQGATTAAPLLFALRQTLANAGQRPLTQPAGVTEQEICWPSGLAASNPVNRDGCMRRLKAWVVNDTIPPTLEAQPGLQGSRIVRTLWLTDQGRRAEPACAQGQALKASTLILWPAALEPWLPSDWRRQQRLPAAAAGCELLEADRQPLQITSVSPDSLLRVPGEHHELTLNLRALGGSGERFWYLDGRYIGKASPAGALTLQIEKSGHYQLSVSDQQGNVDMLYFDLSPGFGS
ncbi:penicillin-binding protein 1C [Pokkaliibacter sp. CJK22405]|uniref:penicillin-binding protein 1C n=1 Tax=Pokkaliibacter sp. CJK22405 TaxID=3384615 RepID=UPI0039855EB9